MLAPTLTMLEVLSVVSTMLAIVLAIILFINRNVCAFFYKVISLLMATRNAIKTKYYTDVFEEKTDANPDRPLFITTEDGKEYTYDDVDKLANQIARWALDLGCKRGDTIALMMPSHPNFVSLWIGFAKMGAASALLNVNSTGKGLVHCLNTSLISSEVKVFIVDISLQQHISADLAEIEALGVTVLYWDTSPEPTLIKLAVTQFPNTRLPKYAGPKNSDDPLIYIFTSGTTGLPKACKISHTRFYQAALPGKFLLRLIPGDRYYCCLPLYHSGGGMLGLGAVIEGGATMVLRRKFSVSKFSIDCATFKVTAIQYIGELGRYLSNAPPSVHDDHVKIRVAYGNGMRPEFWKKFCTRYNVEHVVEFYGATEGNIFLFNDQDIVGALGYIPPFLQHTYPTKIIRTKEDDKSEPWRDPITGFTKTCEFNEAGLLVSPVSKHRAFNGYTDEKATNAKLIRGLFKKDDCYFNTGDLLSKDSNGFFYWVDRAGDTFRWKGENVATSEVASVLSGTSALEDVNVYGVAIPNCDGKAGMAVICLAPGVNTSDDAMQKMLGEILALAKLNLPVYARPLFLRVRPSATPDSSYSSDTVKEDGTSAMSVTTTYKHLKGELVKEGFAPASVGTDLLFYFDGKVGIYKQLGEAEYAKSFSEI